MLRFCQGALKCQVLVKPSHHQREAQGILHRRHRGGQVSLAVLFYIGSVSQILDRLPMDSRSNKDYTGKQHGTICCCFFFPLRVVLKEMINIINQQQ